jgi:hypothetical protein
MNVWCLFFFFTSEGKVEMLGKESIHAIVLGVFSAAIMSDDITERFKFKRVRSTILLIIKEIAILILI